MNLKLPKAEIQKAEKHILWIITGILLIASIIYSYRYIDKPYIPFYIVLWGFIGSTTYVVKTACGHISKDDFDDKYIPYYISRIIIGPAFAIVIYFMISSGSFFGITIKVAGDTYQVEYAYVAIAFMSGYFVRRIIEIISIIFDAIFGEIKSKG